MTTWRNKGFSDCLKFFIMLLNLNNVYMPYLFKGTVESIAMKTPKERTQMFEKISRFVKGCFLLCHLLSKPLPLPSEACIVRFYNELLKKVFLFFFSIDLGS